MQLTVNGEPREVTAGCSVQDLLESLGVEVKTVVVERNEDIVPRTEFADTVLADGDAIEMIRFVGGG